MTQPLYNLQAWKEAVGIGDVHIPTQAEVDTLKRDRFAVPATEYKEKGIGNFPGFAPEKFTPKADPKAGTNAAYARSIGALADQLAQTVRQQGSIFFQQPDQGITSYETGGQDGEQRAPVRHITFDLILSESHDLNATVCSHPVQDGAAITDHIQLEATKAKVQVLVTEYSLKDAGYMAGDKEIQTGLGRDQQEKGYLFIAGQSRARAAWETFKAIMRAGVPVKIVTVLDVYPEVAITHVGAPRDGGTGEAMIFDVEFTQIRRVSLHTGRLDNISAPALPKKTAKPTAAVVKRRKATKPRPRKTVCVEAVAAAPAAPDAMNAVTGHSTSLAPVDNSSPLADAGKSVWKWVTSKFGGSDAVAAR